MKVPVFLTTLDPDDQSPNLRALRYRMFDLCRERWRKEPGADLQVILPQSIESPVRRFQRERRVWAESQAFGRSTRSQAARKPFYVLADDDCLPISPKPFLRAAVSVLRAHPEFAMLSLWPENARIRPWRPTGRVEKAKDGFKPWPFEDSEVLEHVDVGGIRVCRAGCIEDWPKLTRSGYDREHAEALRANGYRVGYLRKFKMNHIGQGYSTVW